MFSYPPLPRSTTTRVTVVLPRNSSMLMTWRCVPHSILAHVFPAGGGGLFSTYVHPIVSTMSSPLNPFGHLWCPPPMHCAWRRAFARPPMLRGTAAHCWAHPPEGHPPRAALACAGALPSQNVATSLALGVGGGGMAFQAADCPLLVRLPQVPAQTETADDAGAPRDHIALVPDVAILS
jgi:hypothetical protein